MAAHRRGKGASFTQALVSQGYGLWLVAWFPGDRTAERAIKLTHHVPRFCPLCRAGLCVIDQPPQHTRVLVSSRAQDIGNMDQVLDATTPLAVADHARDKHRFRQEQLLVLTDHGPVGAGDARAQAAQAAQETFGGDTLMGDTFVELLPSDAED